MFVLGNDDVVREKAQKWDLDRATLRYSTMGTHTSSGVLIKGRIFKEKSKVFKKKTRF